MVHSLDDPVWYVAFGSNLHRERLCAYLAGQPTPGSPSGHVENGARDTRLPEIDEPATLPHPMLFAGASKRWKGGGAAFLDSSRIAAQPTLARRYRITWGQLEDIHRQENLATAVEPANPEELSTGRLHRYSSGRYDLLLFCGVHDDGAPMATITCSNGATTNTPDHSYLTAIATGLHETGYPTTDIERYLSSLHGVAGSIERSTISNIVAATLVE